MDDPKHADHFFGHMPSETLGHSVFKVVLPNASSKWSQQESENSDHTFLGSFSGFYHFSWFSNVIFYPLDG